MDEEDVIEFRYLLTHGESIPMKTISRSLPKTIVRLFIAIGVVAAFIGVDVSTAAGDDPSDSIILVPDYTESAASPNGTCDDTPTVSTVTMTPQDPDGNVVDPGMGVTFILPTGSPVVFLSDPVVAAPGADGAYSVQVTSTIPGVFEVGGMLADGSHAVSVRVPFRNGPLDADQSSVTVTQGTRLADNNDAHMMTFTLVSQCDLPIDLAMASSDALALSAVDAASGVPVTVSRPPVDPDAGPGLMLVGYFQTSPGTYNALLVSNRPGIYDLTVTFSEQTSYSSAGADQITAISPNPLTVQFISATADPTGTLTVDPAVTTNDSTVAAATVVDDRGAPAAGVDVSFQISGNARFDNGDTAITVPTDGTGRALAPITTATNGCDDTEFDVTASISPSGVMIPLDGSPVHVTAVPPPGACHLTLGIALRPSGSGTVYANDKDSWTGIFTLTLSNGNPVLDAGGFIVRIYQGMPTGDPTDAVSISTIKNNGDGTYSVQFTTSIPGIYFMNARYADTDGDFTEMAFEAVPTPSVTQANTTHISGTAPSGTVVRVDDANGEILGTDTAHGNGTWSIDTPADVPSQQITVSTLGDTGAVLAQVTAWLDTDRPGPPRIDQADMTQVAGGLGAVEPFAQMSLVFPDGSLASATAGENGSYTIATPPDMSEGTVTVYQSDTAGNQSDPATAELVVPPPPPALTARAQLAQVQAGGTQTVVGENFLPGELVSVSLCPTCSPLAAATANETGDVTLSFTVPADTAIGDLTVTLTGAQSGSVDVSFEVIAAPAPPAQCWLLTLIIALLKLKFLLLLF